QPPRRRDGGHDDRGPGGRDLGRSDQDRLAQSRRAHREIQPATSDRGGAGGGRPLRGRPAPGRPKTRRHGRVSARAAAPSPAATRGRTTTRAGGRAAKRRARLTPRAAVLLFTLFVLGFFAISPIRSYLSQR